MRVTLVALMVAVVAGAQSGAPPWPPADSPTQENLPARPVGVDDLLSISVYRSPELTRTVRVEPPGVIRLPMLPGALAVEGKMPAEVEDAIAGALQREGILMHPVVTVTVAAYGSRPVRVAGAVRTPVTFQASGALTLLDAISRAGGLAEDAADEILVTRQTPQGGTQQLRIRAADLLESAGSAANLALYGGEEIRVPQAGKVFLVGSLRRPGAFPVPKPEDATILKLLARAEGLAEWASRRAYLYRPDGNGGSAEIQVDLEKILKRQAADLALVPGDILYVPDNSGRRTAARVADRITSFGVATASGLIIWGRR